MSQSETSGPNTGTGRGMKVLLVVSLAFNLLIVGAFVGAVFSGGKWDRHHGHPDGPGGPLTRALSEEDRRVLRRQMLAEMLRSDTDRISRRDTMAALLTALRADPYDPAAALTQMDALRDGMMQRMQTGQRLLSDRLAEMNAADRAAYADRLERALRRHR